MANPGRESLTSNVSDSLRPTSESVSEVEAAAGAETSLELSTSNLSEPLIPAHNTSREKSTAPWSSEKNRVSETQSVPIRLMSTWPKKVSWWAVALCLAVTTFLLVLPFVAIQITPFYTVLSTTGRNVYTAMTTITAGLISAIIMGQLKELWVMDVLYVERRLSEQKVETSRDTVAPDGASTEEQVSLKLTEKQHRRVVVALGLGDVVDKAHFFSYALSILVAGLMTTGMVAGVAPEIVDVTVAQIGNWRMPIGLAGTNLRPEDFDNWRELGHQFPPNDSNLLFWQTDPKTWVYYNLSDNASGLQGLDYSASNGAMSQYLDTFDPIHGIAYVLAGVPIAANAIGLSVFVDEALSDQFVAQLANYDWNSTFENPKRVPSHAGSLHSDGQSISSKACVPVLTRNPVRCEASCSPLHIHDTAGTRSTVTDATKTGPDPVAVAGCGNTFTTWTPGPENSPLVSCGICLQNQTIGHATYLIAEDQTTGQAIPSLHDLLAAVNGSSSAPSCNVTTLVTCQVDLQDSLAFRMTSLEFLGQVNGDPAGQHASLPTHRNVVLGQAPVTANFMQYGLTGGVDECGPDFVDGLSSANNLSSAFPDHLGYGITAAWKQIRDQQIIRPLMNAIHGSSGFFNESQSELEDLFGVVHGMALSQYYQGQLGAVAENTTSFAWPRTHFTATSMRICPGNTWAVVYALPTLYTLALLLWFLYRRYLFAKTYRPAPEPGAM